jgi:hypothetical protein
MGLAGLLAIAQEEGAAHKADAPKSEPKYDDTFSGPIVELSAAKITVSRSILGKPAEKRTFWIKPDTRIEGKLKVKVRVTVGFVTSDDGDVARLIVVRSTQRPPQEKK